MLGVGRFQKDGIEHLARLRIEIVESGNRDDDGWPFVGEALHQVHRGSIAEEHVRDHAIEAAGAECGSRVAATPDTDSVEPEVPQRHDKDSS